MAIIFDNLEDFKKAVSDAVQESHTVTRANIIEKVTENTEAQHKETRKQVIDMTQAQQDVTRGYLKDRIAEAAPADLAADINAAGLASAVRDELVKILEGK